MSSNTPRIERVELFPVELPMIRSFSFASGSAGEAGGKAPHLFLKVTDSEGAYGWGEGRPVMGWSSESLGSIVDGLTKHAIPQLIGHPLSDRWGLHRKLQRILGRDPSPGRPIARAALDIAIHDLLARRAGMTLRAFLGGDNQRRTVHLSYTLTATDRDSIRSEMEPALDAGFRHFNFKAAVKPESDIEVAETVADGIPNGGFVWADANQGFRLHEARMVARRFESLGVDLLEQPLPADQMHLMAQLRSQTAIPLAVDESSVGATDFFRYAAAGLVDYLVVKLTRSGGIWPTVQQIHTAEAAGLPFVVSGLTDGLLTKIAACQVALVYGCDGPAALNGSQFTDESQIFPTKADLEFGGAVHLNDEPGLGVAPDEAMLRSCTVQL